MSADYWAALAANTERERLLLAEEIVRLRFESDAATQEALRIHEIMTSCETCSVVAIVLS